MRFLSNKLTASIFAFHSPEETRRAAGLYAVFATLFLFGLYSLILGLNNNLPYKCIPGDVSLLVLSTLGIYGLAGRRINYAVNTLFLSILPVYFYFISAEYAFMPVNVTLRFTLWAMVTALILMFFFSRDRLKLALLFGLGVAALLYHAYAASQLELMYRIFAGKGDFALNPLISITLAFAMAFGTAWTFDLNNRGLREQLDQTENRTNQLIRQLPQGLLALKINRDDTGTVINTEITRVNHVFESLFRVGARELKHADANLIFPKVFRDSFDWNNFFYFSKKNKAEFYVEHLDRWIELVTLTPEKDVIVCLFNDISARQSLVASLTESRKRYKVLLEAIPDLFFIIDKDGIYVDFVVKDSEKYHINPDDIIGNSIYEVGFSERMSRKIFQYIQESIRFDSIETIEYALEIEQGTAMFEMRIAKLDDNSVITIARDITKRKLAEIRLEEAKQKAEEADQLKSAFLANISHEIRTPMNAIIGFSRMIGSPDFDTDEKNRFIEIIINNGRLLMEMVNDMISISKIESKQVVVHKGFVKINDLLVDLYREYSIDVSNKPVKIKLSNENANPKFGVSTDRYLLAEILKKLIDNAIKFTSQGEIEFGYRMAGKNRLQFFVKDTGIGIEQQNLARIFERFHQIDNKTTRKYEGTGLGLAIAQHYAVTLGGKIEVESVVNRGSHFYFDIPFENGEGVLTVVR